MATITCGRWSLRCCIPRSPATKSRPGRAGYFLGRFPHGSPSAQPIGNEYATILAVIFNQLRDMDQADVSWEKATEGVGVLLADSAMFQRAEPALSKGVASGDPLRPTRREVEQFSAFYGLAMPLVKCGVPSGPSSWTTSSAFPAISTVTSCWC